MTTLAPRERLSEMFWPFESLVAPRFWDDDAMAMRMEEFVDGDDLVVRAEMPGVDPDKDVEITVADGALTISAHRENTHTEGEKGKPGYRSEFRYGAYRRRIALPAGVTADAVKATYADGILEVRMPVKGTEPKPTHVTVTRT